MLIERVQEWRREIEARAEKKAYKKAYSKAYKKALKEGLEQGRRDSCELLLCQLEFRFGKIDDCTRGRVLVARHQSLLKWAERLVTAERLIDVFGR